MMNSLDFDSLFLSFDAKISQICMKLALVTIYDSETDDIVAELNQAIVNTRLMLKTLDECLTEEDTFLEEQMKRLQLSFEETKQRIEHIETQQENWERLERTNSKKVSKENKKTLKEAPKSAHKDRKKNEAPLSRNKSNENIVAHSNAHHNGNNNKPTSAKSAAATQTLKPIQQFEFQSIPSYMLGRLTLSLLNETVEAFSNTLKEKYSFLKKYEHASTTNDVDYKRLQVYKAQETPETKGIKFCTVNDIRELSSMKNDTTIRKALLCLRHCKRIKEIRGGGANHSKLIRYCVV